MNPAFLTILIMLVTFAFVGGMVVLTRRIAKRQLEALATEGILLDSGKVMMTFRFENFRGPRVYMGIGLRKGPGRVVLTRERFVMVPLGQNAYGIANMARDALERFRVDVSEGQLHLRSENPLNATGTVDILMAVADPAAWALALAKLGAKAA